MVTLPNHNLRNRVERMERHYPPALAEPEVIIRVYGDYEQGGYTMSQINYGTHTEFFIYDLDPDEYAEFMTPIEGVDDEPVDILAPGEPSDFQAPAPEPEPEPDHNPTLAARQPPIRITPSEGPRHLDPVLAYHLRLPESALAPPVRDPLPPRREFSSPVTTPGRGPAADIRLTFSSPKSPRKRPTFQ
ncbi:MAG: hypothetical protein GC160_11600 [Acidobacteria bacterium]|nr:hypothetical protein [Acidobacteriota bacterium]